MFKVIIISQLVLFFMLTWKINTRSWSLQKKSFIKDTLKLTIEDAEKPKEIGGSELVFSSTIPNSDINRNEEVERMKVVQPTLKNQDSEDLEKTSGKVDLQNKNLGSTSFEDPQYPKITATKTIAKADWLTYMEGTVSKGGEPVSAWEFVKRDKEEEDSIDIVSSLVIQHVEGQSPYATLSIVHEPVYDSWILDTLSWENLKGEEPSGFLEREYKKLFGQELNSKKGTSPDHTSTFLFESGIQAIDPGLSSSTEKTFLQINHLPPRDEPLTFIPTESGFVVYIPLEKLDEVLFHWNKEGLIVNSRLANLATGIKLSKQLKDLNQPILDHQNFASQADTASSFLERYPVFRGIFEEKIGPNPPANMEGRPNPKTDAISPEFGSMETGKTQDVYKVGTHDSDKYKSTIIDVHQGKWISLKKKSLKSENNIIVSEFPFVERKRRDEVGVDSVSGLVIQKIEGLEAYIPLVLQFRAPHGDFVLEAPAGLRKKDEKPADAFKRELLEETGAEQLDGTKGTGKNQQLGLLFHESGVQGKDPSISTATAQTFLGINYLKADHKPEETNHDEDENIIVVDVPVRHFQNFIYDWNRFQLKIDSGLANIGAGMILERKLSESDLEKDMTFEKSAANDKVSKMNYLSQVAQGNEKLWKFLKSQGKI